MAVQHHHVGEPEDQEDHCYSFLLDALYCEEDQQTWEEQEDIEEDKEEEEERSEIINLEHNHSNKYPSSSSSLSSSSLSLHDQDLLWEDEEMVSLFSKEQSEQKNMNLFKSTSTTMCRLAETRNEGVEWMMKVNGYYGFSPLTAVLAVNYFDRFLCSSFVVDADSNKPWMIQLVSVACISLAAKVEETHVPLLLDLQVGDTKYVFEAKTIQRMELLVLSTLEWKMHPVTPIAFLDHIIRRLGLKYGSHWDFLRKCERLILSIVSDSRSLGYLPSVVATATMMHVIDEVEPCNSSQYKSQLHDVLQMDMDKVKGCYQLIVAVTSSPRASRSGIIINSHKRKYEQYYEKSFGCDHVHAHDDSNRSCNFLGSSPAKKFRLSSSSSASASTSSSQSHVINNNNNKMSLASLNPSVIFSGHR